MCRAANCHPTVSQLPPTALNCRQLPQVTGEEEIPEGVVAVITPDAPDVLSHVSVRARNMRVLFATCHDDEPLEQLKVGEGGRKEGPWGVDRRFMSRFSRLHCPHMHPSSAF